MRCVVAVSAVCVMGTGYGVGWGQRFGGYAEGPETLASSGPCVVGVLNVYAQITRRSVDLRASLELARSEAVDRQGLGRVQSQALPAALWTRSSNGNRAEK